MSVNKENFSGITGLEYNHKKNWEKQDMRVSQAFDCYEINA